MGNLRHNFITSWCSLVRKFSSVMMFNRLIDPSGNYFDLFFFHTLVVIAGTPMRIPLGSMGFLGSSGIIFLFTVMPILSKAFSASLPVTPLLEKTSTKTIWLSVPPNISLNPYFFSSCSKTLAFFIICLA